MAQALEREADRYVYAGTGTYGIPLPEPVYEVPDEAEAIPQPLPRAIPLPGTRPRVGTQISFPSVFAFVIIIGLAVVLVYNIQMLFREKADIYATGAGSMQTGLRTQLDELKLEEEKLIAEFERTFGYDYVSQKAVALFDMVPGTQVNSSYTAADKAVIPAEAYAAKPIDIVDKILGYLG